MLLLRHQLYVRATREALIEGQHREGARFAGRLADEVVGKVGWSRLERDDRSTDDRIVLDCHPCGTNELAKRCGDGRPILFAGDSKDPGNLDQNGRREERAPLGDGSSEGASGPLALCRIVLDNEANGDVRAKDFIVRALLRRWPAPCPPGKAGRPPAAA